ncbi:MAG: GNAT family N-acetyltransferase [Pseudomonadota bacterium]
MNTDVQRDISTVSLLLADPSHAARIAALHHIVFRSETPSSAIQDLLSDSGAMAFMATSAGAKTLVGYVMGRIAGDDAEILWVGVDTPWRKCGVGSLLLRGFERAAANVDVRRIVFEVAVDNEAALALYKKAGFERVGTRDGYYQRSDGDQVDAAVLAKAVAKP